MRRLSGRSRSALIIGLQGIRARKLRTLLSMVSLFLGVLAVVVVQAGASIAEKAMFADTDLQMGVEGTRVMYVGAEGRQTQIVLDVVGHRSDAVAMVGMRAVIGEPGVRPVNEGGAPIGENWGGGPGPEAGGDPAGQAVEVHLSALTGDVRVFRPFRHRAGHWLSFGSVPALAPRLVLNEAAAKAFRQYHVPAQMRLNGKDQTVTPQFVGVVDDGDNAPQAYVRLDELDRWTGGDQAANAQGNPSGDLQVLMTGSTPVTPVLQKRLKAAGSDSSVETVRSREDMEKELKLIRLIFLGLAGLVLLIGVAGILNVGLASVGERVEEFALRRAVGTPRLLLAGIVLTETLLTGMFTAAAAIGASAGALRLVSMLFGDQEPFLANVAFPWEAGVAGIIAGLVAGILGGGVPALRAAGIPIATVMRA
ncbi:ABC transporter permease [Actinoplanes sp. NPDC049265]|uniref:ABC transporter permease n=1 Tax=Actinoplanes sp. NPDC049265 TaxID=3363902 RepID=UPI00371144D9